MTVIYSYAKAIQNFDSVLKRAYRDGKAKIRKDDQIFVITPDRKKYPP